jgi:KaiB-like protein
MNVRILGVDPLPALVISEAAVNHEVQLTLFVTGSAPSSVRAKINLEKALSETGHPQRYRVTVIDLCADPTIAIIENVIVTPSLVGTGLKLRQVLIGDLSDSVKLKAFLKSVAT